MIKEILTAFQDWLIIASREIYWPKELYVERGVPQMVYGAATIAAIIVIIGAVRAMRVWFRGRYSTENQKFLPFFFELTFKAVKNLFSFSFFRRIYYGLGARITKRKKHGKYAFFVHFMIMIGFIGSMIATTILFIHEWVFHEKLVVGIVYLVFALAADLAGVILISGTTLAIIRRYINNRDYYQRGSYEDAFLIITLFIIGMTGLLTEASRLYGSLYYSGQIPEFEIFSFAGYSVAMLFQQAGLSEKLIFNLHFVFYIVHLLLSLSLAAFLPHSKFFHVAIGTVNILLDDFDKSPRGRLIFNAAGVKSIEDFTFKELLECSTCMKCHFCHSYCPAQTSGEVLSPMQVIQDIKNFGRRQFGLLNSNKGVSIHGEQSGITDEVLWGCVTCYACVNACPHLIGHIDMIVGLRASLIEEGCIPGTLTAILESVYNDGNIWGQSRRDRTKWTKKLTFEIPEVMKTESKILWLPGDTLAFDPRNQKVAIAMAMVLHEAGIEYGILSVEKNDGNDVRRIGEEALFQTLAEDNIKAFKKNNVKKIITSSPHGFNTIKNEYPEFNDGVFDVIHYSEFLWELIEKGKIKFTKELDYVVTYHDPCYLGRYNGVFDAPRKVLQAIPGIKLVEMTNIRDKSFCCGGGGGGMFRETPERVKLRISEIRALEAKDTKASILVTACPFCMSMLIDATKTRQIENELEVKDLVELVVEAMNFKT
ncbi:MAG: (Fe-S)-binding protein [Candidatus Odinarchaeota archaeon]